MNAYSLRIATPGQVETAREDAPCFPADIPTPVNPVNQTDEEVAHGHHR